MMEFTKGARTGLPLAVLAVVALGLVGCADGSSDAGAAAGGEAAVDTAAGDASAEAVVANLRRSVGIAHEKFMALAEAMPEDDYGWRPMEGVRSVGDVYIHVAADNWFGPALMDIEAPEWTGVGTSDESVRAYQERAVSKAQILEEMEESFQHLLAAMDASGPRAGETISLRGNPLTVADLWVRLVVHMHEHLGQAVSYARANEVVPPWSR